LTDNQIKLLSKGLKFIPTATVTKNKIRRFPANLPETPLSTPEENGNDRSNDVSIKSLGKWTNEALQEVKKIVGPRLRPKRARKLANECLEVLREDITSYGEDLGKVLGYGLLYSGEENEEFVRETFSSAIMTVAEIKE